MKTAKKKTKKRKSAVKKVARNMKAGRKPVIPTAEQRMGVEAMKAKGLSLGEISRILKMGKSYLTRNFVKELGPLKAGPHPKFEPTDEDRERVEKMAGYGLTQPQMASVIINPRTEKHIDRQTLQNEFPTELETGAVVANSAVAKSLHEKAIGKGSQSVTAAIWWTKVRMGWRGESLELTGKDGGPIETASTDAPKERLEALIMRQRNAAIAAVNGGDPSNN